MARDSRGEETAHLANEPCVSRWAPRCCHPQPGMEWKKGIPRCQVTPHSCKQVRPAQMLQHDHPIALEEGIRLVVGEPEVELIASKAARGAKRAFAEVMQ